MEKILIFIPMYNCEKQIPRVLERIAALGEEQSLFSGVLVVDNRSTDGSREAALAAMKKLSVPAILVQNCENYSLGDFFKTVGEEYGKKRFQLPIYKIIPLCVANGMKLSAELFGIYPPITPGWVKTFLADWTFSCDKARNELGYEPVSVREGIRRSIEWLRELKEIR